MPGIAVQHLEFPLGHKIINGIQTQKDLVFTIKIDIAAGRANAASREAVLFPDDLYPLCMHGLPFIKIKNLNPAITVYAEPDKNFINAIAVDIAAGWPGLAIDAVVIAPVYLAPSQAGEIIIKNFKFPAGYCRISFNSAQPYDDFFFPVAVDIEGRRALAERAVPVTMPGRIMDRSIG